MSQRAVPMSQATARHGRNPTRRFDRAEKNETILAPALYQDVQQPIHAVVEVHIRRTGLISCDEFTRTRARPRVAGFIISRGVGFRFHNDTRASSPDEFTSDQFPRT